MTEHPGTALPQCVECGTPYEPDAQFCDHCGTATQAGAASAPAADEVERAPGADALDMVRTLVRDKTRFEPEDMQQRQGEDVQQPLTLRTAYALDARLVSREINGANFSARSQDVRSASRHDVDSDAWDESTDRLKLAHAKLEQQLAQPDHAYNAIGDGVYLGAARRHWHMDTCGACHGDGRVTCHTCHGRRKTTCYDCQGMGQVSCTAWGCSGGRVNCSICHGMGTVTETTTESVMVTVQSTEYRDGQSYTTYNNVYEYRPVTHTKTCYSCSGGKVICNTCHGSSMVNCMPCNASGSITCRTCSGLGDLQCSPCSGSGQFGQGAWIDVDVAVEHTLLLPEGVSDDVRRIATDAGPHGLVAIADELGQQRVTAQGLGNVRADYQLLLRMVRLVVACNQHDYRLVAYGRPLAWLTLDDIVEDLLRQDLRALSQALAQVADDGLLSADVEALLQPLHAVAASELNADVIESVLDGTGEQAHVTVVSADYAQEVRTAVLGSLRHVYTRQAKRSWWHGALAGAGAMVLAWLFSNLFWGVLAGLAVAGASFLLFKRRMRGLLVRALGGDSQADRAIALATRSKRQRRAYSVIVGPVLAVVVALGALLPWRGPWSGHAATESAQATSAPASTTERAEVDAVLKRYTAGELAYARKELERLAQRGNAAAYGPYGWMVLLAEGQTQQEIQADGGAQARQQRAQPWIDKGLARDDVWARAAQGALALGNSSNLQDARKALAILETAAGQGNGAAMHYLASIYLQGFRVPRDMQAARKWYTQAAALNQPADLYNLGLMEWQGAGGARADRAKAMALWRRAAALGEPSAIKAVQNGRPN